MEDGTRYQAYQIQIELTNFEFLSMSIFCNSEQPARALTRIREYRDLNLVDCNYKSVTKSEEKVCKMFLNNIKQFSWH